MNPAPVPLAQGASSSVKNSPSGIFAVAVATPFNFLGNKLWTFA